SAHRETSSRCESRSRPFPRVPVSFVGGVIVPESPDEFPFPTFFGQTSGLAKRPLLAGPAVPVPRRKIALEISTKCNIIEISKLLEAWCRCPRTGLRRADEHRFTYRAEMHHAFHQRRVRRSDRGEVRESL